MFVKTGAESFMMGASSQKREVQIKDNHRVQIEVSSSLRLGFSGGWC